MNLKRASRLPSPNILSNELHVVYSHSFGLDGIFTEAEGCKLGEKVEYSAYFNPFAPTGHYRLDMSVPGDRDVFKAILGLDKVLSDYLLNPHVKDLTGSAFM